MVRELFEGIRDGRDDHGFPWGKGENWRQWFVRFTACDLALAFWYPSRLGYRDWKGVEGGLVR